MKTGWVIEQYNLRDLAQAQRNIFPALEHVFAVALGVAGIESESEHRWDEPVPVPVLEFGVDKQGHTDAVGEDSDDR